LLEREASVEEITEVMKEEIAQETRGKHLGLIASEKTKAFNEAIELARAEGLRDARAQGEAEAVQKGKAYEKMLLTRAEDEARIEGDRVYKSRLESLHTKMKRKVELEVELEHAQVLAERRSTLEQSLVTMEFNACKDYVRTQAIQLGLLSESATPVPSPPKRAKVGNAPRTASKASAVSLTPKSVTDLQGPPSGRTQSDKIRDLKSLAKQYARDLGSPDDTRISYLEYVESEAEADWTLARMIAG
jgi:hypothetical protein